MRFKRREKKQVDINIENLDKKFHKQMIMIVMAGLLMITFDAVSSITDRVDVVNIDGNLYLIRPEENEGRGYITMKARVDEEGETIEEKLYISLEPQRKGDALTEQEQNKDELQESDIRGRIGYEIRSLEGGFNEDTKSKRVMLPQKLPGGERISWEIIRESNAAIIAGVVVGMMVLVYRNRYIPIKKKRKKEMESVVNQLPEFINKLVLLMSAGLVINSAFERAIEESMQFRRNGEDYFYCRMLQIYNTVSRANGSICNEFRGFAKESGIKELLRISNIINDNINKGVELSDKLQRESELLWINRKKTCEERGRLAETKLTLPLMIFLMVLILITVAPAMMEL